MTALSTVILEPKEGQKKSVLLPLLPHLFAMQCRDLGFFNVEFQASFFTLLFNLHQEALSSTLLSSIRVISSAYLRLLLYLPAILILVVLHLAQHFV